MTANRLYEDALKLPQPDRARLAARLLDSLDPQVDEDVEQSWAAEIARRIEDLDRGVDQPIPWEEARRIILGEMDEPTSP